VGLPGPDSSLNRILSLPFGFSPKSTPDKSSHEQLWFENAPNATPRQTEVRKNQTDFRKSAESPSAQTVDENGAKNGASVGFKGRRRTKDPEIEIVFVPPRFDPDDEKVVVGIMADWILRDIEKELKQKQTGREGEDN
jgi:hypothetical protein